MARFALSMILLLGLVALPNGALAQGRGGSPGGGGGGPTGIGPPPQAPGAWADHSQRREQARQQQQLHGPESSQTPRERPGEAPESSAAPSETGGFLGTIRRFFGFERSQERMNEQGHEHERATEQDRGSLQAEKDGGPAELEK